MASGNLSPRQKMINMMYLVLTALLALNVSKEVLQSFFDVNLSVVDSTESLDEKSNVIIDGLNNYNNKIKSKPYIDLSNKISPEVDQIIYYIQEMKYELVLDTDKKVYLANNETEIYDEDGNVIEDMALLSEDGASLNWEELSQEQKDLKIVYLKNKGNRYSSMKLFNPENNPKSIEYLVGDVDGDGIEDGKASELKYKIQQLKMFFEELLLEATSLDNIDVSDPDYQSLLKETENTLYIPDGEVVGNKNPKSTWEVYNFKDMPSVGALTILSKWQSDIRNIESEVQSYIGQALGSSGLKFTEAQAVTIPSSNYISRGDKFTAQIFISASDKTSQPIIYVGDYDVETADIDGDGIKDTIKCIPSRNATQLNIVNGKGLYEVKTGSTGPKTFRGFIKTIQDDGDKYYPFKGGYTVTDPKAVVSPTKMMVFYKGRGKTILNPIKVSVPGYNSSDLRVSISGGHELKTKNKKTGEYTVKITSLTSKATISVKANNGKNLGTVDFIVKEAPLGNPRLGGLRTGSKVSTAQILNAQRLFIKMPVSFVFQDYKPKVQSCELVVVAKNGKSKPLKCKGGSLASHSSRISALQKGNMIIIQNIKSGGKTLDASLTFTIK